MVSVEDTLENINPEDKITTMKFMIYILPFILMRVAGGWLRKTKRYVERNEIINRFMELTINACFSRCKNQHKCSVFAMNKDIIMRQQAECVLLQNHAKQNHAKQKYVEDSDVVELYVYEEVSVNRFHSFSQFFLFVSYIYIHSNLHIWNTRFGNRFCIHNQILDRMTS